MIVVSHCLFRNSHNQQNPKHPSHNCENTTHDSPTTCPVKAGFVRCPTNTSRQTEGPQLQTRQKNRLAHALLSQHMNILLRYHIFAKGHGQLYISHHAVAHICNIDTCPFRQVECIHSFIFCVHIIFEGTIVHGTHI